MRNTIIIILDTIILESNDLLQQDSQYKKINDLSTIIILDEISWKMIR